MQQRRDGRSEARAIASHADRRVRHAYLEADHAVAGWYRVLARPLPVRNRLRLRGLECASGTRYAEAFYSRKLVL